MNKKKIPLLQMWKSGCQAEEVFMTQGLMQQPITSVSEQNNKSSHRRCYQCWDSKILLKTQASRTSDVSEGAGRSDPLSFRWTHPAP